jgi:hypothetical protein
MERKKERSKVSGRRNLLSPESERAQYTATARHDDCDRDVAKECTYHGRRVGEGDESNSSRLCESVMSRRHWTQTAISEHGGTLAKI